MLDNFLGLQSSHYKQKLVYVHVTLALLSLLRMQGGSLLMIMCS